MLEDTLFKRKKANAEKLLAYGFEVTNGGFVYAKKIMGEEFEAEIKVMGGNVASRVTECSTGEEYALYKAGGTGAFAGAVRAECEEIISDIAKKCFEPDIFKMKQTMEIIGYVSRTYNDSPEYLWEKFPENAVWRRKDNKKWYGAVLTVTGRKLGLDTDETVEILDLRLPAEEMEKTVDKRRFFPGWHMNKKHWYTVVLDGRVPTEEICGRIDVSYGLAKGK